MRKAEKVNGRSFYKSDAYGGKYGIWWDQDDSYPKYQWVIGYSSRTGYLASNLQDIDCPQSLKHFSWWMNIDQNQQWRTVGYALGIRCLHDNDLKGHEMKLDVIKLNDNELTNNAQSHAKTNIPEIVFLLTSKT